ncbi:MAG: hypothetical protein ACI8XM_000671 [Haloarculaceae archaeon]|jgi:hypothetical protein
MVRECMDCGNRQSDDAGRMCPECGGTLENKLMYEVTCDTCGLVDVHETREGAEGHASSHIDQTSHDCDIAVTS